MLQLYKSLFRDVYNVLIEYAPQEYSQNYIAEVSNRLTAILEKYSNHRLARAMVQAVYCELMSETQESDYEFEIKSNEKGDNTQ